VIGADQGGAREQTRSNPKGSQKDPGGEVVDLLGNREGTIDDSVDDEPDVAYDQQPEATGNQEVGPEMVPALSTEGQVGHEAADDDGRGLHGHVQSLVAVGETHGREHRDRQDQAYPTRRGGRSQHPGPHGR
jgi:hypothetical protein